MQQKDFSKSGMFTYKSVLFGRMENKTLKIEAWKIFNPNPF